jgi:hypothetical protein
MATETVVVPSSSNFPSHDVPTDEKGSEWCMKFLRAMYTESINRQYAKMFFAARDDYQQWKEYALSKQSVMPYRKWLTGSDPNDKTWVNINWKIPTIGSKYRNILVNKMLARDFNIVCTPVDPMAVDSTAKWYADLKAKMLMGKVANKINPELLQTQALAKRTGDPESMEDFEMRDQLGMKTKMAMDAELGLQVVYQQNEMFKERKMVVEDLVDLGVGIYKDWIDENDMVTIRRVNPMNFITSYCRRFDFKDMTYGAELKWMTLAEIAPYFNADQLKKIAENNVGKNGNPRVVPFNFAYADYDSFKVMVCDGEWLSYNTDYYKRSFDSLGNYGVRRKKIDKRDGNATITVAGEAKPKYIRSDMQVVYKGKWIVDTEYIFDWGMANDMKRQKSTFKKTSLSFHVVAPDFYEMSCLGVMERMVPFIDSYCQTYYKIQNFKNRWIPYIISIDIAALENIPLGKGGSKLTPMQVLNMLFQTNVIVTRKKNAITGTPEQNEPVKVQNTQMAEEIAVLAQDLQASLQGLRDVTGINEVTDGTGPADRTNVIAQKQAEAGSNNAIRHFVEADKLLMKSVGESALMRLQRVLRRKPVSGYIHSLGSNYMKFVQVSPDISLREYAMELEDKPENELKQTLMQNLAMKDQNGLIQPEDYFMIMNMTNLKEIELKLIYSSKKRLEQQQQNQQAQQQGQAQAQTQAQAAIEDEKRKTLILEYKLKGELEDKKGAWGVEQEKARAGGVLDQTSLGAIKEVFLQVMQQNHESSMATGATPGGPQPGPAGQPAAPDQGQAQPIAASLQE